MKRMTMAGLVAALTAMPATQAAADGKDFAAGVLSGIIGSAIVNDAQRRNQMQRQQYQQPRQTYTQKTTRAKPTISTAQREENRSVQTALNYFSFPVGAADGSIGPRSRAAIAEYQAYLGYPATGRLNPYERDFLLNAYYRAQSGGAGTSQLIAKTGQGVRGLLIAFRDEQMGKPTYAGAYGGLPPEVAQAVDEIARNSDVTAEQLVQRSGFIQLADMNADGRTDYLLDTSFAGSAFWCNAQSCAVRVFASTPEGYQRNDFQAFNSTPAMFKCLRGNCELVGPDAPVMAAAPVAEPAPPPAMVASLPSLPVPSAQAVVSTPQTLAAPALPSFLGSGGGVTVALSAHCNKVQLTTTQNGGLVTAAAMQDPNFALAEQFCLARSLSMAQGDELAASVPDFTPQQIAEQCLGFGPVLAQYVSALSLQPRDAVIQDVAAFALSTGMAPAQLAGTARICLGVGYARDNMDVAIGSALVLTALGEGGYAELPGHHLSQGFGATVRPDLALDWYDAALSAPIPVFTSGQGDRQEVLRKAAMTIGGRADAPASGSGLPVFAISAAVTP